MKLLPRRQVRHLNELRRLLDGLEEARLDFEAAPVEETIRYGAVLNRFRARIEDLFLNGAA